MSGDSGHSRVLTSSGSTRCPWLRSGSGQDMCSRDTVTGFDGFLAWTSLMHEAFGGEIHEAASRTGVTTRDMFFAPGQIEPAAPKLTEARIRRKRPLREHILRSTEMDSAIQEACGVESLRRLRMGFSPQSSAEAPHSRSAVMR